MKLLLIGAGNMGGAMLKGLQKYDITVVVRSKEKEQELKQLYPNVKIVNSIPCVDDFLVILAVKPKSLDDLQLKGEAKALISVLAGISLERLKSQIKAQYYIRAMPNMAAIKQKSATSLCGDESLKQDAIEILSSIGKCFWFESEDEFDIAMALAGCAPAWLALVAEALSDGAVNLGLKRDISYEMISVVFGGVGATLEDMHPAILKDKVTSPKGTTIAGIKSLEDKGVRSAFIEAIKASYERSKKV